MSLSSVLNATQTTLDGLPSARFPNAKCRITPLVPGTLKTPIIHVWAPSFDEVRAATGFKKVTYQIACYCKVLTPPSWNFNDTGFFDFLEQIQATLRALELPFALTDNDTGETSNIVDIGEQFGVRLGAVRGTRNLRQLIYEGMVTCKMTEWGEQSRLNSE